MYLVPNLLRLVTVDSVLAAKDRAHHNVIQVSVQLYRRVLGPGQTAPAEHPDWHVEIAPELLAHNIGGDFGRSEDGVKTLVDRHPFIDAIQAVSIVPTRRLLLEWKKIRPISIHLVSAGEAEWRIFAKITRRYEHIKSAAGIYVEVVIGY